MIKISEQNQGNFHAEEGLEGCSKVEDVAIEIPEIKKTLELVNEKASNF